MGPRIETERLTLRLPELADVEAVARHAGEYDVAKQTGSIPHPYPQIAVEMWVLQTRAAWTAEGNQSLIIECDQQVAGGGGVFKRSPDADWELGYWIAPPFWGRGLATEAGRALVEFARDKLGADTLIAGHYVDNPASGRVLEKLGFRYTGEEPALFSIARMGFAPSKSMVIEAA